MYEIDIHPGISRILDVFYKLGMWKKGEESGFRKIGRKLLFVNMLSSLTISCLYGTTFLKHYMSEFIFATDLTIVMTVTQVKCIYILWKKHQILKFLLVLSVHSFVDVDECNQVKMKLNNFVKFINVFIRMTFVGALFVILASLPIFSMHKVLPLNVELPWDWRNNKFYYWLSYTLIVCDLIVTVIVALLTPIIWYLMLNCAIKYQCLGNQFKRMATAVKEVKKWKVTDQKELKKKRLEGEQEKLFLKKLVGLIKTHLNIRETIDELKAFFGNLFLAQITTSGICICSSIYVLAFSDRDNLLQIAIYVMCIIYNFFDIFMIMYLGNEIMLSSDRLSYCLFESNWIEQSQSVKKHMIIFTEILKQPHQLAVGKLYPLNLETFTSILHFAYNTFNILKNFR